MNSIKKVVIVGAGGAGLAAAVSALQAKPSVDLTVLEQNATYGGITQISTGIIRACDSPLQKAVGRQGVSKADAFHQYLKTGLNHQDPEILEEFVEKSGEAIEWLISLGCKIELLNDFLHGVIAAREGLSGGTGITETLYNAARNMGTKFLFETMATDLITNDKKEVVGVKTNTRDNRTIRLEADAVVLADGGFWGADAVAFDKDVPAHLKEVIIAAEGSYPQGGKGDGARMARAVGAELQNMEFLEYTAQRYIDSRGNLCPIHGSDTIWSQGASIILNQSLERFLNEDLCYAKETLTDEIARELIKRHEKWFWNICDEKSKENTYRIRFWISKGFIEDGFMLVGNTIKELAQKMGVDPVKLEATISRYNSYFAQGLDRDPQFGRDLKRERAHPLNQLPFYAIRAGIQCNNRRGGISTDEDAHALKQDNKPIPGLYVAGSSMNAVKFDGMGWLSGTGLTACTVWGKVAGRNAALGI